MSWSATAKSQPLSANEITRDNFTIYDQDGLEEANFAITKALEVITEVLYSGALGDPEKHRFNVSLSGHANVGNEPAEGWVNDCLSISISQAS